MKKLITICMMVVLVSGIVHAANVSLSGMLSGTDDNLIKDDGDGNYDYAMSRTAVNTFYWTAGATVEITGTVDVRNLASGSYLQIGLVDKAQADLSLDTYNWGGYMFNNSAFATFYAGTRNYARLSDNNDEYSAQLFNPAGTTVGIFDFTIDISNNGNMELTLHGDSDASITYTYGTRNWWDGSSFWGGAGELENGSYLIAQLWIDTGNMTNTVSANYDINGNSIPEPTTMSLLAIGVLSLIRRKNK